MKAIIFVSISKNQRSRHIADTFEGDLYEIKPLKKIRFIVFQMLVYGFKTVAKRNVKYEPMKIDYDPYDEIVIISPVWAGQVSAFMRQYLQDHPFINKKVRIVATCDGGEGKYFESVRHLLDERNDVIEEILYIKGEKVS